MVAKSLSHAAPLRMRLLKSPRRAFPFLSLFLSVLLSLSHYYACGNVSSLRLGSVWVGEWGGSVWAGGPSFRSLSSHRPRVTRAARGLRPHRRPARSPVAGAAAGASNWLAKLVAGWQASKYTKQIAADAREEECTSSSTQLSHH